MRALKCFSSFEMAFNVQSKIMLQIFGLCFGKSDCQFSTDGASMWLKAVFLSKNVC